MELIKKIFGHLKTILVHKKWVLYYCYKCGIPYQGIMHDMSKFSWTEFSESVRFYQWGKRSPIDAAKEEQGYSLAWQHHKGRNLHHYEHWTDNYDSGTEALVMPFKYALEMLCDYLGAGKTYMGKNFTYNGEYKWWEYGRKLTAFMHPAISEFISQSLQEFAWQEYKKEKFHADKKHLYEIYMNCLKNEE